MKLFNVDSTAWILLIVDKHTVLVAVVPYSLIFLQMNLLACSKEGVLLKLSLFCIIHNCYCKSFSSVAPDVTEKKQITFKLMS